MNEQLTWSVLAAAIALLAGACITNDAVVDDNPESEGGEGVVIEDGDLEIDREAGEPEPLVVIDDGSSRVEWLPPDLPGDEPEVVITVADEATPIILPDLVERVGTVHAYLALVGEDQPLHPALLAYAYHDTLELAADRDRRRALVADNARMRADFDLAMTEVGTGPVAAANGCSQAQKNHARNAYGAAYSAGGGSSGTRTCGNSMGFHNADGNVFYCNIPGGDCDYNIGECDPEGCTTVRGRTRAHRARMQTSPGGSATYQHYGLRYRFGFKNCSGTYNAVMRRKRGSGDWIHTTVLPGHMQIRVGGGAAPAAHATARYAVAWGVWEEHRNWGTSSSPFNRVNMVAQTEGFLCGDIIQRFDTYDYPTGWCNGGKSLCDDNSCSGEWTEAGCWD